MRLRWRLSMRIGVPQSRRTLRCLPHSYSSIIFPTIKGYIFYIRSVTVRAYGYICSSGIRGRFSEWILRHFEAAVRYIIRVRIIRDDPITWARKITDIMIEFICTSFQASLLPTYRMLRARTPQVIDRPLWRQLVGAPKRTAGLTG